MVERNLVFSLTNVEEGRLWTIITAIFVHANLIHLLGNMIFLYVFGNTLESVADSKRMLGALFLGGLVSFPRSLPFFPPNSTFAGASAAIFTLRAVVMLIKPLRFSWLLLMPVGLVAILYFLYNGVAVYCHFESNVAYVSHIIGHWLGLPLGIGWSLQWKRNLMISIGLLIAYFATLPASGVCATQPCLGSRNASATCNRSSLPTADRDADLEPQLNMKRKKIRGGLFAALCCASAFSSGLVLCLCRRSFCHGLYHNRRLCRSRLRRSVRLLRRRVCTVSLQPSCLRDCSGY